MRFPTAMLAAALAAGCAATDPAPAATTQPMPAPGAPAMMAKPPAPAAAPIDKTPVKADLSKVAFPEGASELLGWDDGESRVFYYTNGLGELTLKVPADGEYELTVNASCQAANGHFAKFVLEVDGQKQGGEVSLRSEDAKDHACRVALKAGERRIGVRFTNDMYKENEYDLNFYLHGLKLVPVK